MDADGIIMTIIWLAVAIFYIVSWWKVFVKAGQPGWACIIPIYNAIVVLRIAGKPGWWFILMLIPVVNLIITIIALHAFSRSFGKGVGFTVGLILLSIVFVPILAFGSARYLGPGGESQEGAPAAEDSAEAGEAAAPEESSPPESDAPEESSEESQDT